MPPNALRELRRAYPPDNNAGRTCRSRAGIVPDSRLFSAADANTLCVPCTSAVATRATDSLIRRSLSAYLLNVKWERKRT